MTNNKVYYKEMNRLAVVHGGAAVGGDGLTPDEIIGLFALEQVEVNLFRDRGVPGGSGRLFGGQVAAQALAAAGQTVTEVRPHSLHAYFLRPGDARGRVLYQVDRLHDGRTFRRRRVTAIQRGEPILCLDCSFTADPSEATDFDPAPRVPAPPECAAFTRADTGRGRLTPWNVVEARRVPGCEVPLSRSSAVDLWIRFRVPPADGVLPEAMLTYLSDLSLASTAVRPTPRQPHGRGDVTDVTSLDHSVWFHRRPDLADWLLYAKTAPAVGPGRALSTGRIFNRDGTLAASVAQEALLHTGGKA